jgi:adenosyl cobinamide kinase/adenosyl cobinamide phosphate guanylyltransferase
MLILGGARAGKSAFALRLAQEREAAAAARVCFIATAEALDDDMAARIAHHRAERPGHWQTVEEPRHLDRALDRAAGADVVIVDCLTLFVSNWLLAAGEERACAQEVDRIMEAVLEMDAPQTLLFVSNEVGLGVVPDTPLGRSFRDVLGRVNQRVARAADRVYLLVAGLPLQVK